MENILYEKNSRGELFKKLADDSYEKVIVPESSELSAWRLVRGEPELNTELDDK